MSRSNLAYDLTRFEQPEPKAKHRPQVKVQRAVEKSAGVPKTLFMVACCGAIMFFMLYGKVEAANLQKELSALQKQVSLLNSENVRMKSEIERKTTIENVERYAEEELGLKKLENSQRVPVQMETDNVVEIPEDESNIFVRIKNKFESIVAYLMG